MQTEKILVRPSKGIPSKMLEQYLDRCVAALPALKEAVGQSDYRHAQVFGHRLKGTGAAYGVPVLTEIGSLIEQASRSGNFAELARQVDALENYLGRIEVATDF